MHGTLQQSKSDSSWERVAACRVGCDFTDFRLYAVTQEQPFRVTVRNLLGTRHISSRHMYVDDKGVETDDTKGPLLFKLVTAAEEFSLAIKDDQGETVLELHFVTIQKWKTTQAGKCAAAHDS